MHYLILTQVSKKDVAMIYISDHSLRFGRASPSFNRICILHNFGDLTSALPTCAIFHNTHYLTANRLHRKGAANQIKCFTGSGGVKTVFLTPNFIMGETSRWNDITMICTLLTEYLENLE